MNPRCRPGRGFRRLSLINQDEDQLLTLTSTLTFIASAGHHNRSVTCSASYPRLDGSISGPRSSTLVLSVFCKSRPTTELIFPPEASTRLLSSFSSLFQLAFWFFFPNIFELVSTRL